MKGRYLNKSYAEVLNNLESWRVNKPKDNISEMANIGIDASNTRSKGNVMERT